MAQVGRAGPLQLLRGTREPRESGRVSESGARALVAYYSPPKPEAPDQLDTHACPGYAMASSTACAPPLSGCSLRRHSSEIRTGCANQRPSGSVRGATRNGCPYRARQLMARVAVQRTPIGIARTNRAMIRLPIVVANRLPAGERTPAITPQNENT